MRPLALFLLLVPLVVLADNGLRTGNSTPFLPVRDLECQRDGGLTCFRDAGTTIGALRCTAATATETGCVTPSAQSWSGTKTQTTGGYRIVGSSHATLTACASGTKGLQQTCTTHSALVWCDGTTNLELVGSTSGEQVLTSVGVSGVPIGYYGAGQLSAGGAWTVVNAVKALWVPGTGSGALSWIITDGISNTCTCDVDCDVPGTRATCSGVCAFAAGTVLFYGAFATTCTTDPVVLGNLEVMGVTQ